MNLLQQIKHWSTSWLKWTPKKWVKEILSLVVIMTVISFAMDVYYTQDMPNRTPPPLVATTLEGESIDLSELAQGEQGVLVYFWATWCGPCKLTSPTVDSIAKDYPVVTVAMSSGDDTALQQYLKESNLSFPVINDPSGQLSRSWGVRVTPSIALIKNDEIKHITTGVSSPWGLRLRLLLL